MTNTQSGFPVIHDYGDPRIMKVVVDGVNLAPGVLGGDVARIARWCAQQFAATVAPLKAGQCWGYAPRQIRGGTGWSNHASGSAWDFNTVDFPQGRRNMTARQRAACRAIVNGSGGVLRWGGDYVGVAVDEQHFEINNNLAGTVKLHSFAAKFSAAAKTQFQEDDMPNAKEVVDELLGRKFTFNDYNKDAKGEFEPMTYTLGQLIPVIATYMSLSANRAKKAEREISALTPKETK